MSKSSARFKKRASYYMGLREETRTSKGRLKKRKKPRKKVRLKRRFASKEGSELARDLELRNAKLMRVEPNRYRALFGTNGIGSLLDYLRRPGVAYALQRENTVESGEISAEFMISAPGANFKLVVLMSCPMRG